MRYNADGVTVGPTDVAELEGVLYLLTGEGTGTLSRAVLRIEPGTGRPVKLVDFLDFAVRTAKPDYFDRINVISNPYAMIPDPRRGRFLVTDGATGKVYSAGLDGQIEIFSEAEGHEVLAGIVRGPDGAAYVASFSPLPHERGAGSILRLEPDGSVSIALDGLTTPIDLGFDALGRLYVLEFASEREKSHPYRGTSGRLVRFERRAGKWAGGEVLMSGLPHPTAVLIGADQTIYVAVHGAYSDPGQGKVLAVETTKRGAEPDFPLTYREP